MNIKRTRKTINFMPYLLLLMVIVGSYLFLNTLGTKINELSYTPSICFPSSLAYYDPWTKDILFITLCQQTKRVVSMLLTEIY